MDEGAKNFKFPNDLPTEPHLLASQFVKWLESIVKKSLPISNGINCTNIMCAVPRLGGTFHLVATTRPGQRQKITGTTSPYFQKIKELNLIFPNHKDLQELVKFSILSPISTSAAHLLLQAYSVPRNGLPKLPKIDNSVSKPENIEELLFGLLTIFSNLEDYERIIGIFQAQGYLSTAIQCLLGLLPQFNDTEAAAMRRSDKVDKELPGTLVNGIRWITEELKINLWQENSKLNSPRDRAFWLLSSVESLQWPSGSEFGIIDSLYSFLISIESKDIKEDSFKEKLDEIRFFLDPITFYFNCDILSDEQKEKVGNELRSRIFPHVNRLVNLAACFAIWQIKVPESYVSAQYLQAIAIIQALLNISSPKYLECITQDNSNINLFLANLADFDIYNNDNDTEPSKLFSALCDFWGVYKENPSQNQPFDDQILFQIPQLGSIRIAYEKEKADIFKSLLKESNIEFGKYLHDALGRTKILSSSLLTLKNHWYEKAFDRYYIQFDKNRHQDKEVEEFDLRSNKEIFFYETLFTMYKNKIYSVLDIGIGYGRLAKKLLEKGIVQKENYYGIDLSSDMISECSEIISSDNLRLGHMREAKKIFPEVKIDLAVLAYTTFGCYCDKDDEVTLNTIADIINPWGHFIIEQHNPSYEKLHDPVIHYKENINNKEIYLVKTTRFHRDGNDHYVDYTGNYCYYNITSLGAELLRDQYYCVRLYSENWLRDQFQKMNFYVEFYSDFDTGKPYETSKNDAIVMICHGVKLPYEFELVKKAINGSKETWLALKTNKEFPKKITEKSFEHNIKTYRKIVNKQPNKEILLNLSKLFKDRSPLQNDDAHESICKLFIE